MAIFNILCSYQLGHQIILHQNFLNPTTNMIQGYADQRKRVPSEALTSDSSLKPQVLPMSLRPTEDPDFPPELELEVQFNEQPGWQQLRIIEKFGNLQINEYMRLRKTSEGEGYTILNFLSKKSGRHRPLFIEVGSKVKIFMKPLLISELPARMVVINDNLQFSSFIIDLVNLQTVQEGENLQYLITSLNHHVHMLDQLENQDHPIDPQFNQYKELLQRVATFTHLAFYNRKLASPYTLASHGFKKSISRDGHVEARCVDCARSFLLDPIVEEERMELKDPFNLVLNDHEEQCKFYSEPKAKNILAGKHLTTVEYGVLLFRQILSQNCKHREILQDNVSEERAELSVNEQFRVIIKKLIGRIQVPFTIFVISLMGWKRRDCFQKNEIQCQFCGQIQFMLTLDICNNHRSFCIISQQEHWKLILGKFIVLELNNLQGDFEKTEAEALAKKIRDEFDAKTAITLRSLNQLRFRITGFRNNTGMNESGQLVEPGGEGNSKRRLKRMEELAEELETFLRSATKKVKAD